LAVLVDGRRPIECIAQVTATTTVAASDGTIHLAASTTGLADGNVVVEAAATVQAEPPPLVLVVGGHEPLSVRSLDELRDFDQPAAPAALLKVRRVHLQQLHYQRLRLQLPQPMQATLFHLSSEQER
jgi:hypothetical protein